MGTFTIEIEEEEGTDINLIDTGIAGEDLVAGQLCYLNTDGYYWLANASDISTCSTEMRIAKTNILTGESGYFYTQGSITTSGLTVGVRYYVSDTSGDITTTELNSPSITRYIGTASLNTELEFNPMDFRSEDVFYSELSDDLEMQTAIGSIPAGTTIADLQGYTFTEYIEAQNFPTIEAYINDASNLTLSGYSTSSVEVGTNYTFSAVMTYDPGEIYNGDGTLAGDVTGEALEFVLTMPDASTITTNPVVNNTDTQTTSSYSMVVGSNTWTLSGTNEVGTTTYTDNKGGTDTVASIESAKLDTVPTNASVSKTAYYPYIYGMSTVDNSSGGTTFYNDASLIHNVTSRGSKSISLIGTDAYVVFGYPASHGALSSIVDGNGFDVTSSFTQYTVDVTSTGLTTDYTESYYIYQTLSVTTISGDTYEFNL